MKHYGAEGRDGAVKEPGAQWRDGGLKQRSVE